ncbi:glycosyltransferase [Acetobacteroides hydrogenigenes]|uniref:Cellulose synthase/poly-beta-1,6-N-acetylglucosamine synthase-like glycosyltransferase n=1 Tax=Acetobacteroides hydrogenigenes TaxID=979970 RepID=A0A4R2EVE4_9BACT|nr:glycosyltransferase [Acetobacteroides hydrogenigenes]TCN72992.1 cellulose synthase/poly-beta-1,6-N-acetylglucosamine synthase-like glycosyltransferase [Acetobacteroides hydrogenigenes]
MGYTSFSELAFYQQALLVLLTLTFLIQLVYYIFVYGKVGRFKQVKIDSAKAQWPPVSVVICARNEEGNLKKNIPIIAEQDYTNYEIVVVDDCSEDDTHYVLKSLKAIYPHLRQTFIKKDEKFWHGKKLAVTVGIKSAMNEIIILTDADCAPKTNQWLKQMVNAYNSNTEVVLGYCGYERKKGILNKIIRCDAFFVGLNYLGLALCKAPYMGVGRNLSYKKGIFFKNRGFANHHKLISGDDDLFINEVATGKNTKVCISKEALLVTEPKTSWDSWIQQKTRHGTTYKHYRFASKANLAIEMISRLAFLATAVALAVLMPIPYIALGFIFVRIIIVATCFKTSINKLQEYGLWFPMILFDIISPVLYLAIYLKRKFTPKRQQWS